MLKKSYILVMSLLFIFAGTLIAQDTVDVAPGFNVIQPAIDANPGKVLRLERGGIYTNDVTIEVNAPLSIVGKKEPSNLAPPLINMYTDPGQAGDKVVMYISADFDIHHVGFTGITVGDEDIHAIFTILVPNITWTMDHCTIQSTKTVYWAGKDSLTINWTNNTFWGIYNNGWWNGGYFGNWGGNDVTFNFVNNTVIGAGRVLDALNTGPLGLQLFDHNTYVNVSGELYYLRANADFVVTNNIMYNVYHRGYVGPREEWGFGGDYVNVTTDTLEGVIEIHPLSNAGIDDYARDIRINNNLRYTHDNVLEYMKNITASWQPMFTPLVIARADTFGWKIAAEDNFFEEVENLVRVSSIDPQFTTDPESTPCRDIMEYWNYGERDSTLRDLSNWPPYPTWYPTNPATGEPFNRFDLVWPIEDFINLKPLNQEIWAAADDGYPLGDLNWFGQEVVDAWEAGEESPVVSVEKKGIIIPTKYAMEQNYPNPFNPTTEIRYSIPESGNVTLKVYNAVGQEVAKLVDQRQNSGNYKVNFNASQLASGVYIYKIQVNGFTAAKKMMLLK